MNKISLCMIVKNEEYNLKGTLKSVSAFVDEIIIVDTGSTDRTKDIARSFTEKVYDFKWINDFSAARNFSLEKAENDWVLILDGDETIIEFDRNSLDKFIGSSQVNTIGRIKRVNNFNDGDEEKVYIERVNRFFNKTYYHYSGKIHEQVTPIYRNNKFGNMIPIDIIADHIGYTEQIINKTNKIDRNISLLKEMLKDDPEDIYLYYQLGKSYYMGKDFNKAYDSFEIAINKIENNYNLEYVQDLIESYGYTLLKLQKYEEAMNILKYRKYYVNSPDFLFLNGLILMNNGLFEQSAESFLNCLECKEGKILGINSYLPLYNVGVIFECVGFKNEAMEYYLKCGEYKRAKERINALNNTI